MAKKSKLNLINDDLTWNADRRYKVNSVVQLNGEDYQNITGKNSNPELLIDWQKIYTDIAISDVTGLPTALDDLQLNKENKANKQNSLDTDATGTKYPTVTAVKNAIDSIYQPDIVIRYTAPTRVGNTFTFPSGGYDVLLSKQFHTNVSQLETTIAAATDGFKRIDLIYYKADDTIAKIEGTESATVAVRPEVPAGGIELCLINVFGATIEVPEVNGAYVQKSERANVVLTGSGVINQLNLVDEKATIVFKDAITRLNTISYASVPYNGKRITLFNAQATPVTIGHSVSGYGVDFVFSDAQDYILLPNQTIEFSFDITYAPYAHHMLIGSKTDISGKEDKANKNIANGYAGLDSSGKIIPTQLPALAITDTFVVNSQAAMLALVAEVGDIAVRNDLNKSFILRVTGASTLANWQELLSPTSVDQTIIDGSTNSVSGNAVFDGLALKSNIGHTHVASQITDLSKASVGLGNVDNTSDLSKPLSTATINALATKAPISSVHNPVTLGTPNGLSLSNQQLSLGLANSGVTGALSSTDWNTFNNKQPAITGLTTNNLPKWNGSGFGDSSINEIGNSVVSLNKRFIQQSDAFGIQNAEIAYFGGSTNVSNGVHAGGFGVYNKNSGEWYTSELRFFTSPIDYTAPSNQPVERMRITPSGRILFNTTTDNLVDRVQLNGTISASPATTANQVVVKSQLDAVATSSGTYTPTVLASTNCVSPSALPSTYTKNGNIVTLILNVLAANFTAANTFTRITVNLPVNRTLTDVKNIGSGSGFNTISEYWAAIAQTGANNNTVLVSFRTPSTNTGNITLFVQYDITK